MEVSKDSGYPSRIPLGLASHSPFEAGCVSSAPATPAEPRASRKPICSFSRALRLSGSPELPARCHHGHHALSQRSVSSPSPWLQLSQHSRQEQKSLSLLLLLVPLLLPPPLLPCHRGPGAFLPLTIPESILCSQPRLCDRCYYGNIYVLAVLGVLTNSIQHVCLLYSCWWKKKTSFPLQCLL